MNIQANNRSLDESPISDGTETDSLKHVTIFENESNPYEFFLTTLAKMDIKSLDQGEDDADVRLIIEFKNFLNLNDNKMKYLPLLTTTIHLEAFGIIKKLKNEEVQKLLIEVFDIKEEKNVFLSDLMNDLRYKYPKSSTIKLIKLLELSSNFNVRELLVPLLIEDKLEDIDEILESNEIHRKPFIKIIDEIVGRKVEIPGLNYNKKFVFGEKMKGLLHVGIKLMKKFDIASNFCPNIIYWQKNGRLKFLFYNYYNEKEREVTLQSFLHFVKDLAINDNSFKKEALKLFVKNRDHQSAEWFLNEVNVQFSDIPHSLRKYNNRSGRGSVINFEAITPQRSQVFYKLNLPSNAVRVIDYRLGEFDDAVEYLSTLNVIAYDAEWKTVRLYDEVIKLSLLQMASEERVYIFDMIKLPDILSDRQWNSFGELFSSEHIMKLIYYYSHEEEKETFRGTNRCLEEHISKMANVTDLRTVENELKESHPNIFTYKTEDLKGLCRLVYACFGSPLDKIEQCSYWDLRPLSSGQLRYAALDAFCLIEIFDYLNLKSREMKIDCKFLKSSDVA